MLKKFHQLITNFLSDLRVTCRNYFIQNNNYVSYVSVIDILTLARNFCQSLCEVNKICTRIAIDYYGEIVTD